VPPSSIISGSFRCVRTSGGRIACTSRFCRRCGGPTWTFSTCADGLQLDPEDAELWFRRAIVHRRRGESSEAEQCWRRILGLQRPDQFCSVDQGIYGHLTRRNLAALAAKRGDHAEAERFWKDMLAECPGDREALTKLDGFRRMKPACRGDIGTAQWIDPGSRRRLVPAIGPRRLRSVCAAGQGMG
jgi:tetratricopeptide (TPR) repeat protein